MKKFKRILKIAIPLIIVLVVVLGVVTATISASNYQETDALYFQKLQSRNLSTGFSCNGTVAANSTQPVYNSLKALKAEDVCVNVGDTVKKGQVLCKYNLTEVSENIEQIKTDISKLTSSTSYQTEQLNLQYENAKKLRDAQLEQINSSITYYTDKYNSSKSDYEYYDNLKSQDSSYADKANQCYSDLLNWKHSLENQKILYDQIDASTQANLDELKYEIDKAKLSNSTDTFEYQLDIYNKQMENAEIVAPCDGVITQVNVANGQLGTSNIAFVISNPNELIVKGEISTQNLNDVNSGDEVSITYISNNGNVEYNGVVDRLEYDESSTTGFFAIISLTDEDVNLRIGMNLSLSIYTNQVNDALSVAYDSVSSSDESQYYVYVANEQDNGTYTISKVNVEIGLETDYYTQIISDELSVGDNIICDPSKFTEGDTISSEFLTDIEN